MQAERIFAVDPQTMQAERIFATVLLLLILSTCTYGQDGICSKSAFKHEGKCTACPDRCATCVSHQNCITCNSNYYGPVCQYTCPQDCEELCHKERGYCTEGCADGRFPEPNSPRCPKCPAQCKTCKSLTECFECIPGYYGNACENRCSSFCEWCNKTTGACLVCAEGFNQEGQCRRCPDGCETCSDGNNCSNCQSGYYTLKDGQCIMECPIASNTSGLYLTTYLTSDLMAHGCTDTARGQRFVIKTKKPCIQFSKCSPNIMCTPQYEGKGTCGTIKTYQCSHSCRQLNESYCRCEPNCTLTEESLFSMALCFTNEHAFTDIKLSTESECSNTSEDLQNVNVLAVVLIIVIVVVVAFVSLVLICLMKRHHTLGKFRRDDVESNPSAAKDTFVNEDIDQAHTDIWKPYFGKVNTIHSQDDVEIDETSCLNENDMKDATLDTLKTEEMPMHIRGDPNTRSSCVDSYPNTQARQSTGSYQPTNHFDDAFTSYMKYTPLPKMN